MKLLKILLLILLFCPFLAYAKLSVKIEKPKTVGGKSVIRLTLKNTFAEKIESARAVIFLLNDEGKVIGQATRWVIGGTKDTPALEPGKETIFNFVIPTDKPFTKTKLTFSRIILEGGKVADMTKSFEVIVE